MKPSNMRPGVCAAFLVQRVSPYHHARLAAWAASRPGRTHVIEFRPDETVYAWAPVTESGGYIRHQTHSNSALLRLLHELGPRVVVCTGYADPEISGAVAWALGRRVALVTCSDSTRADEPRGWAKEMFKRRVVAAFDSALIAGKHAHDYLVSLGFDDGRLFRPWDVVDNRHFFHGAEASRANAPAERARLNLPERYFLSVARFVPKKNLAGLVEAYCLYAARVGVASWPLVISGAGPLESELRSRVAAVGLESRVRFPGFLQYDDLPACYGLAGAFVLPSHSDQWGLVVNEAMAAGLPVLVSSRCGCAENLVREGENGFRFDPANVERLAELLHTIAGSDEVRLATMGSRSRELVAAYSPEAFADGLEAAIGCALARSPKRNAWMTRLFARSLAARGVPSP